MSQPNSSPSKKENNTLFADLIYRDLVSRGIAAIFSDIGCVSMEKRSHDIITHMTSNFLNQICDTARKLCDHSGRTEVTLRDVQLSLDTMGVPLDEFCLMLKNLPVTPGSRISNPEKAKTAEPLSVLKIGEPRSHPPHMPSFLPPFPDPHTYIHTDVSGDVDSNYEKVRNISAKNKRDIENSLVNFALSTYPSICTFQEYENVLRTEANNALEHAKRLKQHKIEERQLAKSTQRLKQDLANVPLNSADILMNDLLQEEPIDDNIVVDDIEDNLSIVKEIEQEELFALKETEHSYIRKRIPEFCHVLLPFEEDTPYLSALVTDENLDDDTNHFAKILSKEIEDELAAETSEDFDNSAHTNDVDMV